LTSSTSRINRGGADAADFWLATFADPDGNFFQVASPMPAQ
jgi:hypothetical protein